MLNKTRFIRILFYFMFVNKLQICVWSSRYACCTRDENFIITEAIIGEFCKGKITFCLLEQVTLLTYETFGSWFQVFDGLQKCTDT